MRKLSLASSCSPRKTAESIRVRNGEISFLPLSEIIDEEEHLHSAEDGSPTKVPAAARDGSPFVNPTEYFRTAFNDARLRSAICAIIKSGVNEIRIFREDEKN